MRDEKGRNVRWEGEKEMSRRREEEEKGLGYEKGRNVKREEEEGRRDLDMRKGGM